MLSTQCHHYDVFVPCTEQIITCYFHSSVGCLKHWGLGCTVTRYCLRSSCWGAKTGRHHWLLQTAEVVEKCRYWHSEVTVLGHDSHLHLWNSDSRVIHFHLILQVLPQTASHWNVAQKCQSEKNKKQSTITVKLFVGQSDLSCLKVCTMIV